MSTSIVNVVELQLVSEREKEDGDGPSQTLVFFLPCIFAQILSGAADFELFKLRIATVSHQTCVMLD